MTHKFCLITVKGVTFGAYVTDHRRNLKKEIDKLKQENIRLKQYILELDREAQTGETK